MLKERKKTTKTRLADLVITVTNHGYTTPDEVESGQRGLGAILAEAKPTEELTLEKLRSRFVRRLRKADVKPASVPTLIKRHYLGDTTAHPAA